MANGFLQNSFKVGTPARGGGDLLSAFLGINTNPDVQLKGQLAGARLGNLDARTRRSNILGNQDQINLEDMQTLRKFITPEGDGSGGLNPAWQAMADPRYSSGQTGLATRDKRINLEEGLAELAQGGYMMEINGQEVPLATVLKSMSGADFKNLATTNPAIKKLMRQINEIDLRSADTHDLSKLQQIESGSRNLNIIKRGEILDTQQLTAASREKITAIELKTDKFMEYYKKLAGVQGARIDEKKLEEYALSIGIKKETLKGMADKADLTRIQLIQGIAKLEAESGGKVSQKTLLTALGKMTEALTESTIRKVGQKIDSAAITAAALAIVQGNVNNLEKLLENLDKGKKGGKDELGEVVAGIVSRLKEPEEVMAVLEGTTPGLSANEELANREIALDQPPTGPPLQAPAPGAGAGLGDTELANTIIGGEPGTTIAPIQGQPDPTDAGVVADLTKQLPTPLTTETQPPVRLEGGGDTILKGKGAPALTFDQKDSALLAKEIDPKIMATVNQALANNDSDGIKRIIEEMRRLNPESPKADMLEQALIRALGRGSLQ